MRLSVFRDKYEVGSREHLQQLLEHRHEGRFGAFWLSQGLRTGPALALFINGEEACLFYFRHDGDTGFHSLGPEPHNFEDTVPFVIDNYQLDYYSRAMVVPANQAIAAFEEFFETGVQPGRVRWFEV